jgi:hypothetical protein
MEGTWLFCGKSSPVHYRLTCSVLEFCTFERHIDTVSEVSGSFFATATSAKGGLLGKRVGSIPLVFRLSRSRAPVTTLVASTGLGLDWFYIVGLALPGVVTS